MFYLYKSLGTGLVNTHLLKFSYGSILKFFYFIFGLGTHYLDF